MGKKKKGKLGPQKSQHKKKERENVRTLDHLYDAYNEWLLGTLNNLACAPPDLGTMARTLQLCPVPRKQAEFSLLPLPGLTPAAQHSAALRSRARFSRPAHLYSPKQSPTEVSSPARTSIAHVRGKTMSKL